MRGQAFFEQRQEFMLRAVETTHARVGLRPDDKIQGNKARFRRSGINSRQASPIDECAQNAAVAEMGQNSGDPRFVEGEELELFAERNGFWTVSLIPAMPRRPRPWGGWLNSLTHR